MVFDPDQHVAVQSPASWRLHGPIKRGTRAEQTRFAASVSENDGYKARDDCVEEHRTSTRVASDQQLASPLRQFLADRSVFQTNAVTSVQAHERVMDIGWVECDEECGSAVEVHKRAYFVSTAKLVTAGARDVVQDSADGVHERQ